MEREQTPPRPLVTGDGLPPSHDLNAAMAGASDLLNAADRILDGLHPVDAEEFLQQNRQRGGE